MKIKFLGTAAAEGWPALFCQCESCERVRKAGGKNIRTRSSCLIGDEFLVDFPPDTYMHVLNNNIDLSRIKHLVVTHSHQDHFYPSDLMMRKPPFAHIYNMTPINVYGNDKVGRMLEAEMKDSGTDENIIKFREVEPFKFFNAGTAKVMPLLANHDQSERCYIYIVESEGKKVLYGHDTGYFHDSAFEAIKGQYFDCVILDCTYGPKPNMDAHMGIPACGDIKQRLLELGSADKNTAFIITHFSHNGALLHDELIKAAEPYGFEVAYDGAEFII